MDRDFFFVPFYKETDDYFVNDSCRESLRPSSSIFFILHVTLERFVDVEQDSKSI